jgi:hypothetical protein
LTDDFPSIEPADPIDDMLRRATGDPMPTEDTVHRGMMRLQAAMAGTDRARRSGLWLRAAAVLGVVVALGAVASIVMPDEVTALSSLAEVAESVSPVVATDGGFVYRQIDQTNLAAVEAGDLGREEGGDVNYLHQLQTRTWETLDQIRQEIEQGAPIFLNPGDEAAFAANPGAFGAAPGTVTVTETARVPSDLDARDWSTDPARLRSEMEAYVSNEPAETPMEASLMALAGSLLRDPRIEAPLRAAVLRVVDGIDGIEVGTSDGSVTVSLRHAAPPGGTAVSSMEFDRGAHLLRERQVWVEGQPALGIPPGTVLYDYRYGIPEVVDSVG